MAEERIDCGCVVEASDECGEGGFGGFIGGEYVFYVTRPSGIFV